MITTLISGRPLNIQGGGVGRVFTFKLLICLRSATNNKNSSALRTIILSFSFIWNIKVWAEGTLIFFKLINQTIQFVVGLVQLLY